MKIALVFPGYGSHAVGLVKELYDNHRIIQEYFEEASNCLNINAVKLCFSSSESELAKMENAQHVIFLISCAIYKMLVQKGLQAEVVAGHNTGAYGALFAAGSLTFPDGLYLLSKYASLCQDMIPAAQIKVIRVSGVEREYLERWCASASSIEYQAMITVFYTGQDHCVAGHVSAVNQVADLAFRDGGKVQEMPLAFGLHSSLADSLADSFTPYLEKVDIKKPHIMVVSEADGRLVTNEVDAKREIVSVINKPLRFCRIMDVLALPDIIIEIGPGIQLSGLIKSRYPEKCVIAINRESDVSELFSLLSQQSPIT